MSDYVPTIDDLRVKLCFICREEEKFDEPQTPPRAWVHPCKCSLVAHESCLLEWIENADATGSTAAANSRKCPQCGTLYELNSNNPLVLRALDAGNRLVTFAGKVFSVSGILFFSFTSTATMLYLMTRYGAFALRQFIGDEATNLILPKDPSKWPLATYFNLPFIPIGLIAAQFSTSVGGFTYLPPLTHIFVELASTAPPSGALRLYDDHSTVVPPLNPFTMWPPSPLIFAFGIFPLTRSLYATAYRRAVKWALGSHKQAAETPEDLLLHLRIPAEQQVQEANQQQPAVEEAGERRIITISLTSTFRRIGSALVLPVIANRLGSVLLRLCSYYPLLRRFLAPKPGSATSLHHLPAPTSGALHRLLRSFAGGSEAIQALDPVWWRNTIGVGLFVVAKDCMKLFHLWLARRELESLQIKSRDFKEVDVKTLDLVPGWEHRKRVEKKSLHLPPELMLNSRALNT